MVSLSEYLPLCSVVYISSMTEKWDQLFAVKTVMRCANQREFRDPHVLRFCPFADSWQVGSDSVLVLVFAATLNGAEHCLVRFGGGNGEIIEM